jgi:hypothetical protein
MSALSEVYACFVGSCKSCCLDSFPFFVTFANIMKSLSMLMSPHILQKVVIFLFSLKISKGDLSEQNNGDDDF